MTTKNMPGKMQMMLLLMAVSPLSLFAADYFTKDGSGNGMRIFGPPDDTSKGVWVDINETPADRPSKGNNYWIVGAGGFHDGGKFQGDLLSLGLPPGMPGTPSWAASSGSSCISVGLF